MQQYKGEEKRGRGKKGIYFPLIEKQ